MNWDFNMPVRLFFGIDKLKELEKILKGFGYSNGVLICDPFFVKNGLAQRVINESNGLLADLFGEVSQNPTTDNVDACAAVLRKNKARFAVALGGGSTIDCAKAACAITNTSDSIQDYHTGGKELQIDYTIPLVAVPTTAGTGSEVTSVTVLTNIYKKIKAPLGNPLLYPAAALIDPSLTLGVPPKVTASTGLDVLSHALEGFWSVNHQPLCDALALSSAKLVFHYLPVVFDNPDDLLAREHMCEASLMAGIAFSHPKTSGPHACSFPLTNIYGLPHGEACAFTLDAFTRLNADAENGRLNFFAEECGFSNANDMANTIAGFKKKFGLKSTLRDAGVAESSVRELALKSMHPNILNNPVKIDAAGIEALYKTIG